MKTMRNLLVIGALLTGWRSGMAAPQAPAMMAMRADQVRTWLWAHEAWSFEGRLWVLAGPHRGNGRFNWKQFNRRVYHLDMTAPITGKRWQLSGDTHYEGGTLTGLDSGPIDGEIASILFQDTTGLDIPVSELPDWIRAMPAWDTQFPANKITHDAAGRVRTIRQMGCLIRYKAYHEATDDRPAMPKQIDLNCGDVPLRFSIDRWDVPKPEIAE